MGEITFLAGAAFLNQTTLGTFNTSVPDIGAGSDSNSIDNTTDGAVIGLDGAGIGDSGISLGLGKEIIEKAVVAGSYTRGFADYIARTIESFSIEIPLKGNGKTTTASPVAADFTPDLGVAALFRAAGLDGNEVGATWAYTPLAADLISAAVYLGNQANNGVKIEIRDIIAKSLELKFTPGEIGRALFNLGGIVEGVNETGSWPATPFNYGNQASLSAPIIEGVGFTWGPDTPAARTLGFSDLALNISLETEEIKASNLTPGTLTRQTGRTITVSGTFDAESPEALYETNQLAESAIANAEALTFLVGTAATGSDTANAYQIDIDDPEALTLEPAKTSDSAAWTFSAIARSASANGELSLIYL